MTTNLPTDMQEYVAAIKNAPVTQLAHMIVQGVILAEVAHEHGDATFANIASKRAALTFAIFAEKLGCGVIMVARDSAEDQTVKE